MDWVNFMKQSLSATDSKIPPTIGDTLLNNINGLSSENTRMFHVEHSVEMLPIDSLSPMHAQPRSQFDQESLEGLAKSILTHGVIQPLVVTPTSEGKYSIIAGERRWRASKLANLSHVPCITRDVKDHLRFEIAIIENIQREELSVVDEGYAYRKLIDEHDFTHEMLAERIGKSRSAITNVLRFLLLPEKILADLNNKIISSGHAKLLCGIENEGQVLKIHALIVTKKLSIKQTEILIKKLKKGPQMKMKADAISADLRYICDQFKGHLGTKVKIMGDSTRGKIEINYYTSDDLERISELILGEI